MPMKLVAAEGALLEEILDVTYPIWHDGLTRKAYSQWNTAQLRTPWGREHLHRFALLDDSGRLLASAKRYRHDIQLDGREGWMCGLGAVITPPDRRGHGHATELIERMLDRGRSEGALMAALFSEIGAPFYEGVGFVHVPFDEVTVRVRHKSGAAAILVRAGDERDFPALADLHRTRSARARFTLRRDPPAIHYALSKKRLFAGLSAPGARQVEFFVAEEGASAVAYIVLGVNQHGWTLEEAGDRDPAGARLGAMLQVLVAREPFQRTPIIRAWWPRLMPVPPQLELVDRSDAKDLFMVRPLAGLAMPTGPDDVFYWRSDYF
jgi:GNAT superfamily N-acetyltransferase